MSLFYLETLSKVVIGHLAMIAMMVEVQSMAITSTFPIAAHAFRFISIKQRLAMATNDVHHTDVEFRLICIVCNWRMIKSQTRSVDSRSERTLFEIRMVKNVR